MLEASAIAWPNAAMWRPVSSMSTSFTPAPFLGYIDGVHLHGHGHHSQGLPPGLLSFGQTSEFEYSRDMFNRAFQGWRQPSFTDVSMYDGSTPACPTRATSSRQVTDPMSIVTADLADPTLMDTLCEALARTPTTLRVIEKDDVQEAPDDSITTPSREETSTNRECSSTTAVSGPEGSKRQKLSTPLSTRAIDLADAARSSPTRRKVSSKAGN